LEKENRRLQAQIDELSKKLEKTENAYESAKKEKEEEKAWWHGKFGADQIAAALTGNSRGRPWSLDSVIKSIKVRASGGSAALKTASKVLFPLAGERTVQRRTEHIKFEPGVQHQILDAFGKELETFEDDDLDCLIYFDDMSTKSRRCWDPGTHSFIGQVTLPNVDGLATKATVFVIAGVRRKWKVTSAWHLVPDEGCPDQIAEVILELLQKALDLKLNVLGIVCDMGNRAALKKLGFSFQKDNMIYRIPHPLDPSRQLFCFPDMVHLYKSLKECLVNNGEITLSQEIVEKYNLPSNVVKFEDIEFIRDFQKERELKFVPKLNDKETSNHHFRKMNLPNAKCMLDDKVGATLDFLVYCGETGDESSTTAWFVRLLNRWFKLVTSRNLQLALSKRNVEAYKKAIADLQKVTEVMRGIRVNGLWKVVQTHIIMATEAILEIQEILLRKDGYSFLELGRFLQDIVENLFSLVRRITSTPTAVEFKYSLKRIVLGQFSYHVRKSSYEADDRTEAVGLQHLLQSKEESEVPPFTEVRLSPWEEPPDHGNEADEGLLYRQCGYPVSSLRKKKMLKCEGCFSALQHHGESPHPLAVFTRLTNWADNAQIEVSDEVYTLLRRVEFNLRRWKNELKTIPRCAARNVMLNLPRDVLETPLSPCHDITNKLLFRYIESRVKQFVSLYNAGQCDMPTSSFGSKSMGKKLLAEQLKIGAKKRGPNHGMKRSVPGPVVQRPATELPVKRLVPAGVAKRLLM